MKITILTKAIYIFDAICIKLQMAFLIELEQQQQQQKITMCMEIQNTLKSQNNLEKEEKELTRSGSLTSDYTTSYSNQNNGTGSKSKYIL